MDIEKRFRMAAESILENESIREGLDDSGASALLEWGTACAKQIAGRSLHLENDDEAEEASYPQHRALRQMLDLAKSLYTQNLDSTQETTLLSELLSNAAVVYGSDVSFHEQIVGYPLSATKDKETGQNIAALRALLEKNINPKE